MVGFEDPRRGTLDAHGNKIEGNQKQQGRQAAREGRRYGSGHAKAEGDHQASQGRHSQEDHEDPVREVSASQLRRPAGGELAEKADQTLNNADWGGAIYRGDLNGMNAVVSFGGPGADLPGRFPPSMFGDLVLDAYLMPEPVQRQMVSPLLKHEPPPQITAPRGRSETLRPAVEIETRQSREPRPQSDPSRYLLPGREEQEVRPTKLEKWW
jgi:hypothetical protein